MRKPFLVLLSATLWWASGCTEPQSQSQPAACREGQVATPSPAQRHPVVGHHFRAHAHNDYEHDRPLLDALEHRFYSVEADIFHGDGKLPVSHVPGSSKGTLQQLYLDPLQQRVDALGSVHGDGVPFTLWVDLKEGNRELVDALHALLERYPMLTRIDGNEIIPGPVTVVLTGDDAGKRDFVSRFPQRRAVRDSNHYSPEDPPADSAWRYYALKWSTYLSSSDTGELDAEQRARLACIVENAHAQGRQVRLYGAPDQPEVWRVALELGVDFIHTDKLSEVNAFLESAP
jgi:hypothetical protein